MNATPRPRSRARGRRRAPRVLVTGEPEGRGRQDDDRDQPRHRAGGDRRARSDHRSRSAGQRLDRPRHRPQIPHRLELRHAGRRAHVARRHHADRGAAAVSSRPRPWTCSASNSKSPATRIAPTSSKRASGLSAPSADQPRIRHLCRGRLPAFAQPSHDQRARRRRRGRRAAAVRILRPRRAVATPDHGRAGAPHAQSGADHSRHRADDVRSRAIGSPARSSPTCAPTWATRSTTRSFRAMCASPKRLRTASRRCFTTSNARAARPISSSRPRSFSAKGAGAPPETRKDRTRRTRIDGRRSSRSRTPASPRPRPRRLARRRRTKKPAAGRGAREGCRSSSCAPIRATRGKRFDDDELDELAASIKERGVIQPVVVRPIPRVADAYEIIAGERRWRAAQRAGLHEIPVVVVEVGDREALEIAIVENVQRADLNALEEADGLRPARRRLRLFARRHRPHRRQEPQPCRQHACG